MILLIVFCASIPLSLVAGWARLQIEETDRYVATVAPLASDPAIQQAVTDRVTALLAEQLDERVTIDLIEDRALAAPVALLIEQYIHETVSGFVTSERFPVLWEEMNRVAHPIVSGVLTGASSESIDTDQGQITLDLQPLITEVLDRLSARGLEVVERIPVDDLETTFVIYESEDLARAQEAVQRLERFAVALPILALIALVAAFVVSIDRRSTLIGAGLGLAATMALVLILLAVQRWWVVDRLPPEARPEAVTVFLETIGQSMRDAARLLTVIGVVVAGVAFLTRPASWAKREGHAAGGMVQAAWSSVTARWPGLAQIGSWSKSHKTAIAIAIGVVACLLIAVRDPLTINRALWILLMALATYSVLAIVNSRIPAQAVAPVAGAALPFAAASTSDIATRPVTVDDREALRRQEGDENIRGELVTLIRTLPDEDVRVLSRIAMVLRGTR